MVFQGYFLQDFGYLTLGLFVVLLLSLKKSAWDELVYWSKVAFAFSFSFVVCTFYCFVFAFKPFDVRNLFRFGAAVRLFNGCLSLKYHVRCKEDIKEESAIIVANHQSMLDLLVGFYLWPMMKKFTFVAKRELLLFGPCSLSCWLAGMVFINRKNSSKALEEIGKRMKKENTKLLIFPEGTRNITAVTTRKLLPFKKGAFRTAIACQVPIIPIVMSPQSFISHGEKKFLGKGTIIIEVLPQISTKGLTVDDLDTLIDQTYAVMQKKFEEFFDDPEMTPSLT